MNYCLDDGAALVDGPASMDEPATAVFPSGSTSGSPIQPPKNGFTLSVPVVVGSVILLIVGVGAVAFSIYWFKWKKELSDVSTGKKITRLTTTGTIGSATISPDGKYVVYSAIDEATRQSSLWLRHVATSSNVQIVPPAGPDINFGQTTFSPDSNYVYFIRNERNTRGVLFEVPVLGGSPKKILDDVTRISFSPDGSRFAFSRRDP
ncbi:MAG: hypothetical protein DMF62_11295, partial [Acidobacteria bacterium]